MLTIKVNQLPSYVNLALESQNNLLVVGNPGVGKSQVINKMAKDNENIKVTNFTGSSTYEETVNGIPYHDKGDNIQRYLEPEWHIQMWDWYEQDKKNSVNILFLDEFNTADPQVMTTFLSILTERKVPTQSRPLPPNTVIVAAMNPVEQNDGTPLIRPLSSRFMVVRIDSTLDSYEAYLTGKDQDAEQLKLQSKDQRKELTNKEKVYLLDQLSPEEWGTWRDGAYHELCPRTMTSFFNALTVMNGVKHPVTKDAVRGLSLAFLGRGLKWERKSMDESLKKSKEERRVRNKQYYTQAELENLDNDALEAYARIIMAPNIISDSRTTNARIDLRQECARRGIELERLV